MGRLDCFNLRALAHDHGLRWFIETGTAHGHGLAHAIDQVCFQGHDSIECHAATAAQARERFAMVPLVSIHEGSSPEVLSDMLSVKDLGPALCWLDAHFPGADVGAAGYDAEPDPARRWPLQGELDAIAKSGRRGDVILVDDLRIYTGQTWPYERCVLAPEIDLQRPLGIPANRARDKASFKGERRYGPRPLDLSAFAGTHTAEVWLWMEGYLILKPKRA